MPSTNGQASNGFPVSPDAERFLLSSVLRNNDSLGDVIPMVVVEDFGVHAHRLIYSALIDRYQRGQPTDAALLAEELHSRNQTADVPYAYIAELRDLVALNAPHYAEVVRDRATETRLLVAAEEIRQSIVDKTGSPEQLLEQAEQTILKVGQSRLHDETAKVAQLISRFSDRYDRLASGQEEPAGIKTGFIDLDRILCGLKPGSLYVLAARPSIGKTALAVNIFTNIGLKQQQAGLFVSLEQSDDELAKRMVASVAGIDLSFLDNGTVPCTLVDNLTGAAQDLE
jgi:replicative DNA helicase